MRGCRKRERQQDPVTYKNRVNIRRSKYRLRTHCKVLSARILESIVKPQETNKERQCHYRINRSSETKHLQQKKD